MYMYTMYISSLLSALATKLMSHRTTYGKMVEQTLLSRGTEAVGIWQKQGAEMNWKTSINKKK